MRDYKKPPEQIVFWTGSERIGITGGLSHPPNLEYSYRVIDVRDIDAAMLLDGGGIGESIFAILCKLENPRAVIAEILRRISRLSVSQQKESLAQLLVLSGLRRLEAAVREGAKEMPVSIDLHQNTVLEGIYQDGIGKGKEEGRMQTARQLLAELLETKFGPLPDTFNIRIQGSAFEEIQLWLRKALTSDSLEAVFATH